MGVENRSITLRERSSIQDELIAILEIIRSPRKYKIRSLNNDFIIDTYGKAIFKNVYHICPQSNQRSLMSIHFDKKHPHKPQFCNAYVVAINPQPRNYINIYYVDPMLLDLNTTLEVVQVKNNELDFNIETQKFYDVLHKYSRWSNTNFEVTNNGKVEHDSHKPDIHAREVCLKCMEAIVNQYIKKETMLEVIDSNIAIDTIKNNGLCKNSAGAQALGNDYVIKIRPQENNNFNIDVIKQKFDELNIVGSVADREVCIINYLDYTYDHIMNILLLLQKFIVLK
jgi:hypothetical protein